MSLDEFQPVYLLLRKEGDVVIAAFAVSILNDEENIEQIGQELFRLVDQLGCLKIVLDLSGVEYVTSSVLGKIITLHRKLHRSEGTLVICGLQSTVADVMRTSKLIDYFNVANDVTAAVGMLP